MFTHAILLVAIALIPSVLPQDCIPSPNTSRLMVAHLPANTSTQNDFNYFYVGGLFGVHAPGETPYRCGEVQEGGIQNLEAFLWALSTFKSRLQGLSIGFRVGGLVFDTCSSEDQMVSQLLGFENCYLSVGSPSPVEPGRVLGYVGPDTSSEAIRVAPIFGKMRKTLVSHAATSTVLGDALKYRFLLRTVPSDAEQVKAIVGVLKEKNWKYIQVVYSEDDYGRTGLAALRNLGAAEGVCIVNTGAVPSNYSADNMDSVVKQLRLNSKAGVVVVFAGDVVIHKLIEAVSRNNARGEFTWIGTSTWGTNTKVTKGVETSAEGAITLTLNAVSRSVEDFRLYYKALKPGVSKYNPWFNEYWQQKFNCYLPGQKKVYPVLCDVANQHLDDFTLNTYVPYTIMAVDAIVKGIELARATQCPFTKDLCSGFINNPARWDLIHTQILQVQVNGVQFDRETGNNRFAHQDVYNFRAKNPSCPRHCYAKIGTYTTQTDIQSPIYSYNDRGERLERPLPACPASPCVMCGEDGLPTSQPYVTDATTRRLAPGGGDLVVGDPTGSPGPPKATLRKGTWVLILIILAGLGVLLTLLFEIYLMCKMLGSPFVKHWRTMWLGQLLLLAILVSYLTLFAFAPTPTTVTCAIIRFGVGGSYSMIFSVLLVKLMIIMSSKNVGYLKGVYQVLMFIFAWGVQLVLDAEWLILRPPTVIPDNTTEPVTWMCSQGFVPHVQTLVYVMFLIAITTLLAIRTHGIVTNHREGVFIGLTCGFAIPVWIGWVLLGFLSRNTEYRDPAMAFGLFITATLALFIMYLPKVRQLNSMGVEGIYAEDDVPDYAASIVAPSIAPPGSVAAGSVIYGPPSYKSKNGSMVYVNGGIYSEPPTVKPSHLHYEGDQNALYLRHPGLPNTNMGRAASVRSAPVGGGVYTLPRRGGAPDSLYATTRVLRMTGELSGKRAMSESGFDNHDYGTLQSNRSGPTSSLPGTLKILYDLEENFGKLEPKSLQDLGSL